MEISVMKKMNLMNTHIRMMMFTTLVLLISVLAPSVEAKVLVILEKGQAFEEVYKGITDDLEGEIDLGKVVVDKSTNPKEIEKAVSSAKPSLIVIVGNVSARLYAKYQGKNKSAKFPPSLIIAALFADKLVEKIKNATAIRYEIPAVTSMVNLRSLLDSKVKKIGVIYRAWMDDMVVANEKFLNAEGLELVKIKIPKSEKDMVSAVKKGVSELASKGTDALWIVTDNALLNGEVLSKAWIPQLSKNKFAVVVNVETLVKTKLSFGTFSVYPDHYGLGIQGANAIFEIKDEDWSVSDRDIEEPVSVKKVLNMTMTKKKGLKVSKSGLNSVDKVIE